MKKVEDDLGLIAKLRIPMTAKRARMLVELVDEYPEHSLAVEPPFLVMRIPA